MRALLAPALAVTAGVCHAQPADVPADPYGEAVARTNFAEAHGDLAAAAQELEALLRRYPQDYESALRLAFTYYRAGRFADSEQGYRAALALRGDPAEATAGLGWALQRQGRCTEAAAAFRSVLSRRPADRSALEGLRMCPSPRRAQFSALMAAGGQAFLQTGRQLSVNGAARLDLLVGGRFALGALYRYRGELPAIAIAGGPAADPLRGQHEVYLQAGYGVAQGGLTLRYALVHDEGGLAATSHHGGLTARVSPYGDILLNLTASLYPGVQALTDLLVLRAAPSWRIPIRWGLGVEPGAVVQWAAGQAHASGFLTAALVRRRFALWAGGKYGDEVRPAYLDVQVIYNLDGTVAYGAFGGASVGLGDNRLGLSYSYDRLRPGDSGADIHLHALTLWVSRDF